jgi:hypothetical protein
MAQQEKDKSGGGGGYHRSCESGRLILPVHKPLEPLDAASDSAQCLGRRERRRAQHGLPPASAPTTIATATPAGERSNVGSSPGTKRKRIGFVERSARVTPAGHISPSTSIPSIPFSRRSAT